MENLGNAANVLKPMLNNNNYKTMQIPATVGNATKIHDTLL